MGPLLRRLAAAVRVAQGLGPAGIVQKQLRRWRDNRDYRRWIREREPAWSARAVDADCASTGPLVSVLMPVYESDPRWLARAIDSVRGQLYPRWELCMADDASTAPRTRELLEASARGEPRIRIVYRERRGHISAASNSALALARGPYLALLDHDDELAPDALLRVAGAIVREPAADLVYTDEDKLDARGRREDAYFKPDFSPDLLLSQNLICHLGVYRSERVRAAGGFREGFEGAQDHDLALRLLSLSSPERVVHVPHVLYHWRATSRSTSGGLWRKQYAHDAGRRAIAEHLARSRQQGRVERDLYSAYRVRYAVPTPPPSVTVFMLERGASLVLPPSETPGLSPELVRVDVTTGGAAAERLNDAVRRSSGEVLVFAAGRPARGWLDELVSQAIRREVGVVGGKVVSAKGRVRHAGYLLDLAGDPPLLDAHQGLSDSAPGPFGRANLVQNLLAVSAENMALRREVFEALAGFDAGSFPRGLFDVDLCLRARARGLRVVFTPYAKVRSDGGCGPWLRLGDPAERDRLRARWRPGLVRDPYWHPALDRRSPDLRLPR